eukprot:3223-Heterococcus_DN1.PRE.1
MTLHVHYCRMPVHVHCNRHGTIFTKATSATASHAHAPMAMLFESTHLACRALTYLANIGPPQLSVKQHVLCKADIFNTNSIENGGVNKSNMQQSIMTVTKASPLRHVVDAVIETNTLCELAVMITTPHIPIRGNGDKASMKMYHHNDTTDAFTGLCSQADFDEQSVLTSYTDGLCELSKLPNTSNAEEQALSIKACSKLLHSIISSVGTAICSSLAKATHVQVLSVLCSALYRLAATPSSCQLLIDSIVATPGGRQAILLINYGSITKSTRGNNNTSSTALLKRCLERFQLTCADDRERDLLIKGQYTLDCDHTLLENGIDSSNSYLMLQRELQCSATIAMIALTRDVTRAGPQLIHNNIHSQLLK